MRALVSLALALALQAEVPSRNTYLLLDPTVVGSVRGADLVPGSPVKPLEGGLVIENHPIEAHADPIMPTVLYDLRTQRFRCWYSIWNTTRSSPQSIARMFPSLAYAESKDGIHWNRTGVNPWPIPAIGATILSDPTGGPLSRPFRLFAGSFVSFSEDGYTWQDPASVAAGLSENSFSGVVRANDGRYYGFGAVRRRGGFVIAKTTSSDFMHWTPPEEVLRGNADFEPRGMSVFRHAGLYMGLVAVEAVKTGRVHCEVAWSPDGRDWRWVRLGAPLLRGTGAIYCSVPVFLHDEVRVYYGQSDPVNNRGGELGLATFVPDGFAGWRSRSSAESVVITKPLTLPAGRLRVSAAIDGGGEVRVSLLGSTGNILAVSQPLTAARGGPVVWAGPETTIFPRLVRVQLAFRHATVFAVTSNSPNDIGGGIYTMRSAYQEYPVTLRVLQPAALVPSKHYPVVYLLPVNMGMAPLFGDGLEEAARIGLPDRYGAIFVAPSFDRWPIAFPDHAINPHLRYESFLLLDVLPFIETHYPALRAPEGRLLAGFSNSGWGAYSLLLRHPDIFGRAASWEGALLTADHLSHPRHLEVFGTDANYQTYTIPYLFRERANMLRRQPPRLILLGYSSDLALKNLELIDREMSELGIPHIYRATRRPAHRWDSGWLEEAVELLLR